MWNDFAIFLRSQNAVPQIWWRDDDATENNQALHNYLQALADIPILLAVIADSYDISLVERIKAEPHIRIAQHGFRHNNYAHKDEKKNEYPKHRPLADIKDELKTGKTKLQKDFGKQFLPVFVPPWNRMHEKFLPNLIEAGFKGVSMFNGNNQKYPLQRYDCHIDIINWKENKSFIGDDNFINSLSEKITKQTQPIGILTHHKIHNETTQSFLLDFHKFLQDNPNLIQTTKPPFAI